MSATAARRVMVVDDSRLQCAVWRKLLEERYSDKVAVETYTDPEEAVPGMAPDIHLLLLDWEMPEMNGKEVLEVAKEAGVNLKRVIITSGPLRRSVARGVRRLGLSGGDREDRARAAGGLSDDPRFDHAAVGPPTRRQGCESASDVTPEALIGIASRVAPSDDALSPGETLKPAGDSNIVRGSPVGIGLHPHRVWNFLRQECVVFFRRTERCSKCLPF